ncbi:MAG: DNA polymerase III subunit delta' [Nitrospirota bacterium]|nr:DNA polymerase III subunit delta' [Nitrospirota bacterium]
MALKDIIGHDRALNILKGCIRKERIPHAFLFAGDEGIGKRLAAVNFAKALNCLGTAGSDDLFSFGGEAWGSADIDGTDACDKCPSCLKTDSGNHPDFYLIGPEGDGGQITVAAVRGLQESLSYKPFEGRWKVAVVDNADRLNQSAANAFLQTLEEPSDQSILVLVSSRPEMVLPTIRSRCQRINFTPLPVDTMSSLLEEKFGKTVRGQAVLLSMLSGGRLGHALDDSMIPQRDRSFDVFRQMLGSPEEDVWDSREDMEQWFDWGQLWLRDIAVFKAAGQAGLLINQDKINEIKEISGRAALADILKLARELYNIRGRLFFNLNKQITLNYTSLLMRKMLGKTNVREQ